MTGYRAWLAAAALPVLLAATPPAPPVPPSQAGWSAPAPPFHVIGNISYVGTQGIAAYLIRTPAGAILIDSTTRRGGRTVARNILALGVPLDQVKVMVSTHAHFDHVGGSALLKRLTNATLYSSGGDRQAMTSGLHQGDNRSGQGRFPPVPVDRSLQDGQSIQLGGSRLTALLTPGHTPGCTSWTMVVHEEGRPLSVIFPCSLTVAGARLKDNKTYPEIVGDFRRSFARLRRIKADVVLTAHPDVAEVHQRAARRDAGEKDAFIDPALFPRMVAQAQQAFERELAAETPR